MDNLEFQTLTSGEFKAYMQTHKEKNYLVNVFCQFKKITETSESTFRNSIRLSRSTLSFSTKGSRPKGWSQAAVRLF
jgi:hypothetical protein